LLTIQAQYLFVEVDVTEMEAKIEISDYFDGAAPVLIVNDSFSDLYYGQKGVTVWESSHERHIKKLPSKHTVYFCWIEPLETRELVYKLNPPNEQKNDQSEQSLSLDFDQYVIVDEQCSWVTFFDGKQRVLIFTNDPSLPQYLLRVSLYIVFV